MIRPDACLVAKSAKPSVAMLAMKNRTVVKDILDILRSWTLLSLADQSQPLDDDNHTQSEEKRAGQDQADPNEPTWPQFRW